MSIADHFEKQVDGHAYWIAVKTPDAELTYAELNAAANRWASVILDHRGPRREVIGLAFEPGVQQIIAILAVLKTTKIYTLINLNEPAARNAKTLGDAGVELILTSNSRTHEAQALRASVSCEWMDSDELKTGENRDNPQLTSSPEDPCWIIYTSGSTGVPKGVVKTHRNVLFEVRNYTNSALIRPDDRLSFINSRDIFIALLNGATAYPENTGRTGFAGLSDWISRERITMFHTVPTMFRQFLNTLDADDRFPSVRLVRLIGEALYRRDVDQFRRHFLPQCRLINAYGTTEAGYISLFDVKADFSTDGNVVPVGYPLPGKHVEVVDDLGKAVPNGTIGEITVSSESLSMGYWNRPELTLTDVCRTGDLGRMSADGCLVHLGRRDGQVKINGNRVDIAEIEMALRDVSGVSDALVTVDRNHDADVRLTAMVIPAGNCMPTPQILRHELSRKLPAYMVPSNIRLVETFIHAEGGKALRQCMPPRDEIEEGLLKIWGEILQAVGMNEIGVQDNFLDLGGTSLIAAAMVQRIETVFGKKISLAELRDASTVEQIARILREKGWQQVRHQ